MKTLKLCLLVVTATLGTSGFLTSEEPFYQESDIKADDRLIGIYRNEKDQTSWQIEKDLDHRDRYFVTLHSDIKPCTMRFGGVLFQVGTNRFLDMLPLPEACDHIAGTPPSPIEILQSITLQPLHMVMKVEFVGTNGVEIGFADHPALVAAAKASLEYFEPRKRNQLPRMVSDTKRQREFLMRFGGDTNIFKPLEINRDPR